jgi:hypothetical protein
MKHFQFNRAKAPCHEYRVLRPEGLTISKSWRHSPPSEYSALAVHVKTAEPGENAKPTGPSRRLALPLSFQLDEQVLHLAAFEQPELPWGPNSGPAYPAHNVSFFQEHHAEMVACSAFELKSYLVLPGGFVLAEEDGPELRLSFTMPVEAAELRAGSTALPGLLLERHAPMLAGKGQHRFIAVSTLRNATVLQLVCISDFRGLDLDPYEVALQLNALRWAKGAREYALQELTPDVPRQSWLKEILRRFSWGTEGAAATPSREELSMLAFVLGLPSGRAPRSWPEQ